MKEGIYHVTFHSPLGEGDGIIVVAGSNVNGGDSGYTYQGPIVSTGKQISGVLSVNRHSTGATSVFGDISDFGLKLQGTHSDRDFQLSGSAVEMPSARLRITGRWLRRLAA